MFKKILVTGGAGFIGSNFIRLIIKERNWDIINLDALTYAGNLDNLRDIEDNPRYQFVHGRIEDRDIIRDIISEADAIVNFAAETHVDRSIKDAYPFITTNCIGVQTIIDTIREAGDARVKVLLHVSTDEVYGSLGPDDPPFKETTPLAPNSPYAASKASADFLLRAAIKTYGIPIIITRCSNNYGPYQYPEKLMPLMTINAMQDMPLPVYGDGMNIRDWIHVDDHCRGILAALEKGKIGDVYNLGGECEKTNLEIVKLILGTLNKGEGLITFVADRLGHDRRYAMNIDKARNELGWFPKIEFEQGIYDTINWYRENVDWWKKLLKNAK